MFEVIPYQKAIELIAQKFSATHLATTTTEFVDLEHAFSRISARDILSKENIPPFSRSTVDGYAVKSVDTFGSLASIPSVLTYIGRVEMGADCPFTLDAGQAVYVPTGGMLPQGADAMVMIEHTERMGEEIFIYRPVYKNENVILKGEDIGIGDTILPKGKLIKEANMATLAVMGIQKVEVLKKLKFAVISTGDEIVSHTETPKLAQIRDTNTTLLSALINSSPYGEVVFQKLVNDSKENFIKALGSALEIADIVIVSGGSSVGDKDYTYTAFNHFTKDIFIKGLALKPGKPTIVAKAGEKLLFGLPGHPMATMITYHLIVEGGIQKVMGLQEKPTIKAKTMINFPSASGRATIIPVELRYIQGEYCIYPLFSKSGLISIISRASGYVILPENAEGVMAGSYQEVRLL